MTCEIKPSRAHAKQALLLQGKRQGMRLEVEFFFNNRSKGGWCLPCPQQKQADQKIMQLPPMMNESPSKKKCHTHKRHRNLHVAPAPPNIQRSLRSPLLAKRSTSSTSTPPPATSPPPTRCLVTAHAAPPPEAIPRNRGPPLELAELSSSGLRLGIEGPDLLQADEAPRELLRVAAG